MIAPIRQRIAPVRAQLGPMRARIAPVRQRVAPLAGQLGPVKQRVAPITQRLARWEKQAVRVEKRVKRRILRVSWIARLKRQYDRLKRRLLRVKWVAQFKTWTSGSIPGVSGPSLWATGIAVLAVWPSPGLLVGVLACRQLTTILKVSRTRPPGVMLVTAALVEVLACSVSLRSHGAGTVWVGLTVGVAAIVTLAQGALHGRVVQRIRAYNLPGLPNDQRAQEPGALAPVVPTAGVLLSALLMAESVLDVPSYGGALVLLVTLAVLTRCGLRLRRMVEERRDGRADLEVRAALEKYAPQFYVYFSGPVEGDYQLKMWLPYLEQLGVPFAVLARSTQMLPRAARLKTTAPIVACPVVTGLDVCMVPSVRAVFYVNINGSIADGVRYIDRTHVHLNHGDSDKPASYHPIFAMFDHDFVAGPAAIERFARHGVFMPKEKCVIVGRPQVAGVTEENTAPLPGRRTVLYAPTWQSGMREMSLSSLDHGERIVRELIDGGARVIFRPHPLSAGQRQAAQTIARINRILVAARTAECPHWTSTQALKEGIIGNFNRSDAMVTDVSSVASDYLASCKPVAVVLPTDTQAVADEEEYPVLRATYLVDMATDDLAEGLAPVLGSAPDPLEQDRLDLRSYYLGDERDSVGLFLREARAVLAEAGRPSPASV